MTVWGLPLGMWTVVRTVLLLRLLLLRLYLWISASVCMYFALFSLLFSNITIDLPRKSYRWSIVALDTSEG